MWNALLPLCLIAMLISGCGTGGAVQTDDGYCALYKPVYLLDREVSALSGETKRAILRNNEVYQELGCDR